MTNCFQCRKYMGEMRSNKELARDRMPVFCSLVCADNFPDNGTKRFDEVMEELEK